MPFQCPECRSKHVIGAGYKMTRKGQMHKMQCQNCGCVAYDRRFKVEPAKKGGK